MALLPPNHWLSLVAFNILPRVRGLCILIEVCILYMGDGTLERKMIIFAEKNTT